MKSPILKNGTIKVIQISDAHLFANDELDIFGVKSNIQFKSTVEKIINEDIFDTDVIFLTGDISQDETEQSYQKALSELNKLNIPIYWIPGNHDDVSKMTSAFEMSKTFIRTKQLSLNNWNFIFVDTKIDGSDDGYLSQIELNSLENAIVSSENTKKIAIVMHHHPAEVGTPLIDNYILRNRDAFWQIVVGTRVELIICGHVHGDYKFTYNDITIESAPATCLQWEKGTKYLKIDSKIGYKIYHFNHQSYQSISKIW